MQDWHKPPMQDWYKLQIVKTNKQKINTWGSTIKVKFQHNKVCLQLSKEIVFSSQFLAESREPKFENKRATGNLDGLITLTNFPLKSSVLFRYFPAFKNLLCFGISYISSLLLCNSLQYCCIWITIKCLYNFFLYIMVVFYTIVFCITEIDETL